MLKANFQINKLSRKEFLKKISFLLFLPIIWLWDSSIKQIIKKDSVDNSILIPSNLPAGVSFFGKAAVVKENNKLEVFSTSCTHLGCRIKQIENGKFICPCHGSEFNLQGEVLKGPATKPLRKLKYELTSDKKQIKILNA
jgi:Rieske Fe-S protein